MFYLRQLDKIPTSPPATLHLFATPAFIENPRSIPPLDCDSDNKFTSDPSFSPKHPPRGIASSSSSDTTVEIIQQIAATVVHHHHHMDKKEKAATTPALDFSSMTSPPGARFTGMDKSVFASRLMEGSSIQALVFDDEDVVVVLENDAWIPAQLQPYVSALAPAFLFMLTFLVFRFVAFRPENFALLDEDKKELGGWILLLLLLGITLSLGSR